MKYILIILITLLIINSTILAVRYYKFCNNKRMLKVGKYKIYSDRNKE
jgi:hypothetical protein